LPPGTDQGHVGALAYLLPYMEQDNQFKAFVIDPAISTLPFVTPQRAWYQNPYNRPPSTGSTTVPPTTNPAGVYGGQGNFKSYMCPSSYGPTETSAVLMFTAAADGNGNTGTGVGVTGDHFVYNPYIYSYNGGVPPPFLVVFVFSSDPGSVILGRTNYVPMGGYPLFGGAGGNQYKGMFGWMSTTRLTDVTDGTSNTIMVGEYSCDCVDFGLGNPLTGKATATWPGGFMFTFWPPNSTYGAPSAGGCKASDRVYYTFGSRHTGIFNVAFGDGSVKGISNNIDFTTWVLLGGMQDGFAITSTNY
jgi:prepilin-type processing-associated H-X9-DG protein